MNDWLLAKSRVYGLINARTDGKKLVMGVLKESESSYQVEEFTPCMILKTRVSKVWR